MDVIEISGLRVFAYHGVGEQERRDGQVFVIDVGLELDVSAPAASDDLTDTVDYAALSQRLASAAADTRFDLIEALAEHLSRLALEDRRVDAVTVRVAKPDAPIPLKFDEVAVTVRREQKGLQ